MQTTLQFLYVTRIAYERLRHMLFFFIYLVLYIYFFICFYYFFLFFMMIYFCKFRNQDLKNCRVCISGKLFFKLS